MKYTLESTLPIRAFEKRLGLFGSAPRTLEGGGGGGIGGIISDIGNSVSDVVSSAGDAISSVGDAVASVADSVGQAAQSVATAVSDAGVAIDNTVRDVIPGGWATVGAIAATIATAGAAGAAMGAVEAGAEVGTEVAVEAGTEAAVEAGATEVASVEGAAEGATVAEDSIATGETVGEATTQAPLESIAGGTSPVDTLAETGANITDYSTPLSSAENQAIQQAALNSAPEFSGQQLLNQVGSGALRGATTAGLRDVVTGRTDNLGQDIAIGGLSGALGGGAGNVASQTIGATPLLSGALQGATSSGVNASLHGSNDVLGAIETGGVSGGAGGAAQMIGQNLGVTNPIAQGALSGVVRGGAGAALKNGSIGEGALIGGIGGTAGALGSMAGNEIQNTATDGTGNTLLGQVLGSVAGGMAGQAVSPTAPQRTVLAGAPTASQQQGVLPHYGAITGTNQMPTQVAGFMPRMSPAGIPIYGNETSSSGLAGATGMPVMASTTANQSDLALPGGVAGVPLGSSPNANIGYASSMYPSSGLNASGLPAPLQAGIMQGEIPQDISQQQLAQLQQLDPSLLHQLTRNMPINAKNGGHIKGYAGGGILDYPTSTYDKTTALFAPMAEPRNSKVPYGNPTGSHWRPLSPTHFVNGQKDGGEQHVPEFVTGATGHYVKGRGDGQSDDIPAMLADGEYVFDADTVAQLGNGSSDAGAKLLDHFRESLRQHKRSAPSDKIPPKANPLAYMKEALKRHKKG